MKNQFKTKLITLFAALFIAVFCVTLFSPSTAVFADYLTNSDIPAPMRSKDLWYVGEGDFKINTTALKTEIASWGLPSSVGFEPIKIAVIDTGINLNHPLFANTNILYKAKKIAESDGTAIPEGQQTESIFGYNCDKNDNAITDYDEKYHGTHVASIIASMVLELGLSDYIKIVPVRAVNSDGKFTLPYVVEAINWACGDNTAQVVLGKPLVCDIVNLSLGILASQIMPTSSWNNRTALEDALETHASTTVFVASAGNESADSEVSKFYPASMSNIISVMSYSRTGSFFSTSNFGDYDLVGPGDDIWGASSGSTYVEKDGTSMATPFVSLGAALLKLRYSSQSQQAELGRVPTQRQIAKMLRNHSEKTLEKKAGETVIYDNLKVLDFLALASVDFSESKYDIGYSDPSRLSVSTNQNAKLLQFMDSRQEVYFSVSVSPEGEYNPELHDQIEWKVEKVNEDQTTNVFTMGQGLDFTFPKTMSGGKYNVFASLNYMGKTLTSQKTQIVIEYVKPDFEKIRVAPIGKISNYYGSGKDVPSYIGYTTVLSLSNIEYVDQTVGINWFVNGELKGNGTVFEFTPQNTGRYEIYAEYNGHRIYYDFFVETKLTPISPIVTFAVAVVFSAVGLTLLMMSFKKKQVLTENGFNNASSVFFDKIDTAILTKKERTVKKVAKEAKVAESQKDDAKNEKIEDKGAKHIEKCVKCGAYVKFTGKSAKCRYCKTEVEAKD